MPDGGTCGSSFCAFFFPAVGATGCGTYEKYGKETTELPSWETLSSNAGLMASDRMLRLHDYVRTTKPFADIRIKQKEEANGYRHFFVVPNRAH